MDIIDIEQLNAGLPTITPAFCRMLAETAVFCLQENSHKSAECVLPCLTSKKDNANETKDFQLVWGEQDTRTEDTYGDLQEATEYGATGLSIILAAKLTKYSTALRSMKYGGFDYWLGEKDDKENFLFQKKARLEISGIFKGAEAQFNARVKQKFKQTDVSDASGYDCYISVIEFSKPRASFLSKEDNYERN